MERNPTFHLYLLAGQLNMAGRGKMCAEAPAPHLRVYALDAADRWMPAADPLHYDKPIAGVGPGLSFGEVMADRNPTVRIGLIPCAAGGSPMRVWQHGGYWEQTQSWPYDDAVRRTWLAMGRGVLKGILWHQGESDSNEQDAPLYSDRLAALIGTLREDLGAPDVPFVAATPGDYYVAQNHWARMVNESLRQLPHRVPGYGCVDSRGLGHVGDQLHFSTHAARELGRRYAEVMIQLQDTMTDWKGNEPRHPELDSSCSADRPRFHARRSRWR